MVEQGRSDQGSLLPPMEQIRNMQSIATTIFVNGMVDGVPTVDLASAVGLAERLVAATTTREAVEQIARLASRDRKGVLDEISAFVAKLRATISSQESGRLATEAAAYAAAFRTTNSGGGHVTLPPRVR